MDDALPLDDAAEILRRAQLVHRVPKLHTRCFQPQRLKNLCFLFYGDRAKEWELLYHKKNFNVFSAMPTFLRNEMLECMADGTGERIYRYRRPEFKLLGSSEWCTLIYLLVSKDLKRFDNRKKLHLLSRGSRENENINRYEADDILRVLMKLAVDCPNLEEFNFSYIYFLCVDSTESLNSLAFYTILQFTNLKYLNLDCNGFITDPVLADLCRSLPNLVSLQIDLSQHITFHGGLTHLSTLGHLKEFKFFFFCHVDRNFDVPDKMYEIYNWCLQNLPNLEHVNNASMDHDFDTIRMLWFTKHPLVLSGTSSLQVLCSGSGLPEATFPKLHTLVITGHIANPKSFLARLSSYKKLTTLHIINVQARLIYPVLKIVGRQLNRLTIRCICSEERFGDYNIFSLCPNLIRLDNSGSNEAVGLLRECHIVAPMYITRYILKFDGKMPNGLLKLIISSPVAERIHITGGQFSKEICQSLYESGGVKSGSLEVLSLVSMLIDLDCDYREIERMAGSLVCNLPNLIVFTILFKHEIMNRPRGKNVLNQIESILFAKAMRV